MQVKIDVEGMLEVKDLFRYLGANAPRAIMRGINRTLAGVRTDMTAETTAVLNVAAKTVRDTISLRKAYQYNLSADATSKGRPLPLVNFGARQTQTGVSVKVLKGSTRTAIKHAFIAAMKSGHKGVFWRTWRGSSGKTTKMERAIGRSGYVYNSKTGAFIPVAALPRKYRLPIEERFGPAVQDILKRPAVIGTVQLKAGERLVKNMEHETKQFLRQRLDAGDGFTTTA